MLLPLLAAAVTALAPGDLPATVTVDHRPLSADTGRVVAFSRAKTIYVCLDDVKQAVTGSIAHDGKRIVLTTFTGSSNSRTVTFTPGSTNAMLDGKPLVLTAPVVTQYGCAFIPLSFFGSPGLRTRVTFAADGRSGNVVLPPGF